MKSKELTRRDFIKGLAFTGASLALGSNLLGKLDALAQGKIYLPLILKAPAPPPSKVVHVHDSGATDWTGSGWYGDHVSQSTVNTIVENGLEELTGYSTWSDIWAALFSKVNGSGYQAGQKIAIKVNFNNSGRNGGCNADGDDNYIDALPQPVKALIAGLTQAGVKQQDIWIYDATVIGRTIPDRFRNPILSSYPNVTFYGKTDCAGVNETTHGKDSSLTVQFSDPDSYLSDRLLADVLYDATYLINMPILKGHGIHPVTLGFKNHFGSLNNIIRGGNDNLHEYINPASSLYESTYSPLVDIYSNPNIKDKTILTLGDGLYGAFGATLEVPKAWNTFGDAPNSLFFSTDPVAIDCVMADFLVAEGRASTAHTYDYLFCAMEAGLGVCEGDRSNPGGDPWGSGYSQITYVKISP